MKTIEITPEMEERARRYHLAVTFMRDATTEESAAFFRASAERHRIELGAMIANAIGAPPTLSDSVALFQELADASGVELAVAVSVEPKETPCAE